MSESELTIIKPETLKSFIWLQCSDGSIQQIEEEVAMFCPMICREILKNGAGSSKNYPISLPERVSPTSLGLILDYCRFHQVPGRSNKERKSFDERFVRIDTERLCELTSAADVLQLKPLVDLTSRALARIIEGKSPEEIREIFHLPDDLTEEEKLEPLKNFNDDPRIRLLNRLYAKKRKELKERQKLKDIQTGGETKDERSVDEILCFINGEGGSKDGKNGKSKKKNKKRRDPLKNPSGPDSDRPHKECDANLSSCKTTKDNASSTSGQSSSVQDLDYLFASCMDLEDTDIDDDDELDPALKEELDKEVEDFARRLNSVWPERLQELLSIGHSRTVESNVRNGICSYPRYTGLARR